MSHTFTNEFGNRITVGGRRTKVGAQYWIVGPNSRTDAQLTVMEAENLRDLLIALVGPPIE